jgi:hypothetical protein
VFADNDGDSSTGFSGMLEPKDCRQPRHDVIRRVWDTFEALPYHRLKPRQDLVNAGFCLAATGREYLVYLDQPQAVDVKLDGGPYAVEWLNARNPAKKNGWQPDARRAQAYHAARRRRLDTGTDETLML